MSNWYYYGKKQAEKLKSCKMKDEEGFWGWTERQTDICDCRDWELSTTEILDNWGYYLPPKLHIWLFSNF